MLPTLRLSFLAGLLGLLAALTGCNTVQSRIDRNLDLFASLTLEEQGMVERGEIDVGFTPDMVYLARGNPDRKVRERTATGEAEVWIYLRNESRYAGQAFSGYRRQVYFDQRNQRYVSVYEPVYRPVYATRTYERARVEFRDGRVSSVEQLM
jgi:hypothetical protein